MLLNLLPSDGPTSAAVDQAASLHQWLRGLLQGMVIAALH